MNRKHGIILDKSYLQGAPRASFDQLSSEYQVLMPDVLFYEMISSDEPGRSRCFGKLPRSDNPIAIVPHVGAFLAQELAQSRPSGLPSKNLLDIHFRFNPQLATASYELSDHDRAAIREIEEELDNDVSTMLEKAEMIDTIFPGFSKPKADENHTTKAECEAAIVKEVPELADFLSRFNLPNGRGIPPKEHLNESWAIFRWLQVQLLFSLDLRDRYSAVTADELTANMRTRIEHDVLDAQYLILGVLEGGFATKEKKLKHFFKLLCPNGALIEA